MDHRSESTVPVWRNVIVWGTAVLVGAASTGAAQDTIPRRLPPVVTVTRDVERSPLDLPFAISSLRPDSLAPGQTHTQVDQTLALLPGVTVANRTNPSQDTRVSVRGFGARSQFGARSIRILRDGMPLTLPDGQTPIDYLDLESVGRVEVIRGPAAALYGNASGGVIDLRSAAPPAVPLAVQARSWNGAFGLERYTGLFGGSAGPATYQGNIGRTQSDGYRQYAHQRLTNAFSRVAAKIGGSEVALVGMGLDMPLAENPGALTRAQMDTAPEQADRASVLKKARKVVHQVQLGLSDRTPIGSQGEFTGQVYGGTRSLYNPLTFAVVGVDRRQGGAGARLTIPWTWAGTANRASAGLDAQWLNDARKNWANCNAVPTANASCPSLANERGVLTLDQRELVSSVGPYLRDEVDVGRLRASAGVRADRVRFELRDHFLSDGRDDSGIRSMTAVSPMVGLAARISAFQSLYATAGSAFETPTTTELGNQSDGSAGLNRDLKPQYSTTYEMGTKGVAIANFQYDVALFDTEVRDELIPFEVPGGNGRTYYRNAGRTRRQGIELELSTDVGPVSITGTYALSHFRFRDFVNGGAQYAGNTIPGIPEQQAQAAATWHLPRAFVVAEASAKSRVWVNDANSVAAPGFAVFNVRAGATAAFGKPWLSPMIGVQNLFDRHYVGSVAINASGSSIAATKFYEPSPGRAWFVGLSAATNPW
ncbi:MAG TPA: TonB-dependent receptor [Gemmatimonadaceae bacterium]|nr:TonB-dependent receptor [Gemmatimonadaceae bacterium]